MGLLQPAIYFLVMGSGISPIYQKAFGSSYIQFIAPGIVVTTATGAAMFLGLTVLWDRQGGFLRGTLVAPVSRVQIAVGRIGGTVILAVVQGLLISLICIAMGFRPVSLEAIPLGFLFLFLTPLAFGALSTAIGASVSRPETFNLIMNSLSVPLFLVSGAMYPLVNISKVLAALVAINPLSYGVDGVRAALTGETHFGVFNDLVVLMTLSLIAVFLAAWRVSRIEA